MKTLLRKGIARLPLGSMAGLAHAPPIALFYHTSFDTPPPYFSGRYRVKTSRELESDLDAILSAGFQPVDLNQLIGAVCDDDLPARSFFLSFDDGYRELAETIAPLLIRKGIPATFFLCSSVIDNQEWFFEDQLGLAFHQAGVSNDDTTNRQLHRCLQDHGHSLDALKTIQVPAKKLINDLAACLGINWGTELADQQPYLSSQQVQGLIKQGFTIGAHSVDHSHFSTLTHADQLRQVRESQEWICSRFDLPYRAFAFPYTELGVSSQALQTIRDEGTSQILFGTRGLVKDEFHPFVRQRLWAEDHPGSLTDYLQQQLTREIPYRNRREIRRS